MNEMITRLCQDRVFYHFHQISQIPHGSGNEKALSDFVLHWARELGLDAQQDKVNNVFIRKAAAPGYENAPVVMLQAHLDMVCEKSGDFDHNFQTDPIPWVVEDDILSTGGKTTLGADDGIGMALAMAILESSELKHPALEVLFTVNEEDDMLGADSFDTSMMKAACLFNLDHANDTEVLCGSCGGMQVDIRIPVIADDLPEGWQSYRLSVSGLKGGHSGEDIHRGRGSANILLNRMFMAIESVCDFRLGAIRGGSFRLAISRDAQAVVWFHPDYLEAVQSGLRALEQQVQNELTETSSNVIMSLAPAAAPVWGVVPTRIMDALALCPDGIYQMNEMLTGLVDTSDNLGEVYLDEHELHLVIEIRAARESRRTYLFQRMQRLANLLGGTCRWSNAYPSWDFRPASPLRRLCGEVYEKRFGSAPKFLTVHAGLEVGCFFAARPELDAVSIGPNCWNFHSPSECVSISSTKKVYGFLCSVLEEIH